MFSCSFVNFALGNPQLFQLPLQQVVPDSPLQARTVTGGPLQQAGNGASGTQLSQGSRASMPEEANTSQGARGLGSCSGTAPRPGPGQAVAPLVAQLTQPPESLSRGNRASLSSQGAHPAGPHLRSPGKPRLYRWQGEFFQTVAAVQHPGQHAVLPAGVSAAGLGALPDLSSGTGPRWEVTRDLLRPVWQGDMTKCAARAQHSVAHVLHPAVLSFPAQGSWWPAWL